MDAATAALATGVGLGVAARTAHRRRWSTSVPRVLHHVAFAASCAFVAQTAIRQRRSPLTAAANAASLFALAALPRTSGGTRSHVAVATAACALHACGIVARSTRT